jgi:hypothetical protein
LNATSLSSRPTSFRQPLSILSVSSLFSPFNTSGPRTSAFDTQIMIHKRGLVGDGMLVIYKKLCRYYFDIDPNGTVFYVNAYREMWEES